MAALAASSRLQAFAAELRLPPPTLPCLEPDVEDVDAAQQKEAREASDLSEGAVRLAVLERGEPPTGTNKPVEGDCVVFHLEVRRAPKEGHGGGDSSEGPPLFSTRGGGEGGGGGGGNSDGEEAPGAPFVALLGPRGAPHRLPRAWELALGDSTPGTRLAVRCSGALYGWGGETCGVALPPSLSAVSLDPKGDYLYDLQLLRFYPSDAVVGVPLRFSADEAPSSALDEDESNSAAARSKRAAAAASLADASGNPAALKLSLDPGTTWESPRPPFEVSFALSVSAPASDGRLGKGEVLWQTEEEEQGKGEGKAVSRTSSSSSGLITATMGDGSLPEALEAALSCVCQGETAVVSLPLAAFNAASAAAEGEKNKKRPPLAFSLPSSLPPAVSASRRVELTLRLAGMVQVRDLVGPSNEGGGGGNDERGRVTKKRVKEGRGEFPADCPLGDCAVRVHVRAVALVGDDEGAEGEVLWDTRKQRQKEAADASGSSSAADENSSPPSSLPPPFEFVIGTGAAPDAVDLAVCLMTPGEISVVESDWAHARFGKKEKNESKFSTPSGLLDGDNKCGETDGKKREKAQRVRFELELVDFEAPDRDPPPQARLLRSEELRAQGNAVLSSGVPRALELASGKYKRAAHLLQSALDFDTEEQHEAASKGRAAAYANLAAVALKRNSWGEALEACGKALDDEPRHAKALFRRATALASLGRFSEADEAFGLAEEADPGAAEDVARERARVAARRKRAGEKQRREMSGFL